MKQSILLIAFIGIFFSAKSQTLNVQAGTTVSHLDWEVRRHGVDLYGQNVTGYSFFVGMEYLSKKYINLSSNIGLIRKGGMMELEILDIEGQSLGFKNDMATLDYFSINTLVDFKYTFNEKLTPFISVGPRVDFLLKSSQHFDIFNETEQLSKVNYGFVSGVGIKYAISKSIVGFRFDYYTDLNNVASFTEPNQTDLSEIRAKMFSLNVSYGYSF